MAIILRSIGIVSPLGNSAVEFANAVRQKKIVLAPLADLAFLEKPTGAMVQELSIRKLLKKRKEAKLFTRAAKLGLIAAHQCLQDFRSPDQAGE